MKIEKKYRVVDLKRWWLYNDDELGVVAQSLTESSRESSLAQLKLELAKRFPQPSTRVLTEASGGGWDAFGFNPFYNVKWDSTNQAFKDIFTVAWGGIKKIAAAGAAALGTIGAATLNTVPWTPVSKKVFDDLDEYRRKVAKKVNESESYRAAKQRTNNAIESDPYVNLFFISYPELWTAKYIYKNSIEKFESTEKERKGKQLSDEAKALRRKQVVTGAMKSLLAGTALPSALSFSDLNKETTDELNAKVTELSRRFPKEWAELTKDNSDFSELVEEAVDEMTSAAADDALKIKNATTMKDLKGIIEGSDVYIEKSFEDIKNSQIKQIDKSLASLKKKLSDAPSNETKKINDEIAQLEKLRRSADDLSSDTLDDPKMLSPMKNLLLSFYTSALEAQKNVYPSFDSRMRIDEVIKQINGLKTKILK